ncbi:MAG TPA: acyl-CoA dehydrogenase family protein [Acidimicrobiia bacterium]|nr:acyl-CoA dehydrogenase family protein [Acidimicrobiia bacterium]
MRFAFSDDQLSFRDAVRDLLTKLSGPDTLRTVWDGDRGYDPAVWSHLAEMGVLGLLAPESAGGLALDEVDLVLILEEAGRAALPGPLVEHAAVAVPTLATAGALATGWLQAAAAGGIVVSAASVGDVATALAYGSEADVLLVEGDGVVEAVERADITEVRPRQSVDGSRRFAEIAWSRATPLPGVDPVLFRARGAAATAAVLCGLAAHLIETTADYVKERRQFGVPVGSFQAVKHHMADALIALEHARPAVYCAAWSISTAQPTLARDASFAKAYANDAAGVAARAALQCHGAIGYTFEHDLHLWLKRVWSLQRAWGDTAHHREQVAVAILG